MVVIGLANGILGSFGILVPVGINFLNFAVAAFWAYRVFLLCMALVSGRFFIDINYRKEKKIDGI